MDLPKSKSGLDAAEGGGAGAQAEREGVRWRMPEARAGRFAQPVDPAIEPAPRARANTCRTIERTWRPRKEIRREPLEEAGTKEQEWQCVNHRMNEWFIASVKKLSPRLKWTPLGATLLATA